LDARTCSPGQVSRMDHKKAGSADGCIPSCPDPLQGRNWTLLSTNTRRALPAVRRRQACPKMWRDALVMHHSPYCFFNFFFYMSGEKHVCLQWQHNSTPVGPKKDTENGKYSNYYNLIFKNDKRKLSEDHNLPAEPETLIHSVPRWIRLASQAKKNGVRKRKAH